LAWWKGGGGEKKKKKGAPEELATTATQEGGEEEKKKNQKCLPESLTGGLRRERKYWPVHKKEGGLADKQPEAKEGGEGKKGCHRFAPWAEDFKGKEKQKDPKRPEAHSNAVEEEKAGLKSLQNVETRGGKT